MKGAFFSLCLFIGTHFLLSRRKKIMRKILSLFFIIITLLSLVSCYPINSTELPKEETDEYPFDANGTFYKEDISEELADYGYIYWDASEKYYVLKPRNDYREAIMDLLLNNSEYIKYWDLVAERIRVVTEDYPSSICVVHPNYSDYVLFAAMSGEVRYSKF